MAINAYIDENAPNKPSILLLLTGLGCLLLAPLIISSLFLLPLVLTLSALLIITIAVSATITATLGIAALFGYKAQIQEVNEFKQAHSYTHEQWLNCLLHKQLRTHMAETIAQYLKNKGITEKPGPIFPFLPQPSLAKDDGLACFIYQILLIYEEGSEHKKPVLHPLDYQNKQHEIMEQIAKSLTNVKKTIGSNKAITKEILEYMLPQALTSLTPQAAPEKENDLLARSANQSLESDISAKYGNYAKKNHLLTRTMD